MLQIRFRTLADSFFQMELDEIRREGPLTFRSLPPSASDDLQHLMSNIGMMLKKEESMLEEMKVASWLMPTMETFLSRGSFNNGEMADFLRTMDQLAHVGRRASSDDDDDDDEDDDDDGENRGGVTLVENRGGVTLVSISEVPE